MQIRIPSNGLWAEEKAEMGERAVAIAVNVSDEEILAAQRLLGRTCGVFGEPAGVTGAAALKKACEETGVKAHWRRTWTAAAGAPLRL